MADCLLTVKVTPRSSREKLELADQGVKVWVMASPTDGQANDAVVKVVSKRLAVAPSRLTIVRGHTSREKVLHIEGMDEAEVRAKLA